MLFNIKCNKTDMLFIIKYDKIDMHFEMRNKKKVEMVFIPYRQFVYGAKQVQSDILYIIE